MREIGVGELFSCARGLADTHPQGLKFTVPLTDKAALAIVGVGHESFVLLIEPQDIGRAGVDTDAATGTGYLIHLNSGHAIFPFGETRDAYAASGGPVRRETIRVKVRPIV